MISTKKGQGSLEVLIIFGVLVIGSIIFGLFYLGNVKNIFVTDPGTQQDRNSTNGDIYNSIEGSLIYNDEQQIASSAIGMEEPVEEPSCGDGTCNGTETMISCPEDCIDMAQQTCGDGTCNGTETMISCPEDCSAGYSQTLTLELIPNSSSLLNNSFEIKLSTQTSDMGLTKIKIRQGGIESMNCNYNGVYDSTFEDIGLLEPEGTSGVYSITTRFSCNSAGVYSFTFFVSPIGSPEQEIISSISKEIREPSYNVSILSPVLPGDIPFEFLAVHTPMYLYAKTTDQFGNDVTNDFNYNWAFDWPEYGIVYTGDNFSELFQVSDIKDSYLFNGSWFDGSTPLSEFHFYVKATNGIEEIVSEGLTVLASNSNEGNGILPLKIQSPARGTLYTPVDWISARTGLTPSDISKYSSVSCDWYYHNLTTGQEGSLVLNTNCLDAISYPASAFGGLGEVLIYVQLHAEKEGRVVTDTRMTNIIITE